MNILAIDTSSPVASAAVMSDGKLRGEYIINNGKTHSQIIIPLISDMLNKAEVKIEDIDVFAVSLGPGSFTGVRIGVATARTFAQALNKKIIGISALQGLSVNVPCSDDTYICPIFDARRGNVYNAIYNSGNVVKADRLVSLDDVLNEQAGKKTIFLGDGIYKHHDKIVSVMGENAVFPPDSVAVQKASSVAFLADIRANKGEFDSLHSVEPIYVRPPQAERELNGEKD